MKWVITFLVLVMMVNVSGASANLPSFDAVLTSQDPFPAEPGEIMEIEVEVQNTGLGEAVNTKVEVIEEYPFELLPGEERIKIFQSINPKSSVKATYKFQIGENAITDDYEMEFRISVSDQVTQIEKLSVSVQGEPKIVIQEITIEPENVEAGGSVVLGILVSNVGSGTAKHLTLTLNSTSELIPVLSEGNSYIGNLGPGKNAIAEIELSVDSSAAQKTYLMKLGANYEDESGTSVSDTFDIGIPVEGTVRLDVIKIEPNYARDVIEIEVANKGTVEAKSVEARLIKDGDIIDIDYISQIKPTKKTTFSFPLITEGTGTLEITYSTPNLQEETITKDIIFSYGNGNGSQDYSGAIFLVIIIIVVGFYFWRRRRLKQNK